MREALVAKGQLLVDRGRYFTIFAPRQAGKTTYFHLLFRTLQQQAYMPVWISFESLKTLARPKFYSTLGYLLARELEECGVQLDTVIEDQVDLQRGFERLRTQTQNIVLVIDEFEDVPEVVLSELLHAFRALYQRRDRHALHALILVGVSTVAALAVSSASPFNVVDQLHLPYFTDAEVQELIAQHTAESGQSFVPPVIKAIYDNTQGQPGLVCALCQYLVEEMVPIRSQPVTMEAWYHTLKHFLTERFDKNILNVVQKAREKKNFMLRVLFDETPIPFTVHDPEIAFLYAHGVLDNINGSVEVPLPFYRKALITAFRPLSNGEASHYVSTHDTFRDYVTAAGLNVHALLSRYREYVQRRGFQAFDTRHLKEAACHYSLDGFIHFFIERLGGETFVEVPTGRGRVDLLILHQQHKYVIETKIFTDQYSFQKGKRQLAAYLASEGVAEGYYVVFSQKHTNTDTLSFDEVIDGKRIYTYIIRTDFVPPSHLN